MKDYTRNMFKIIKMLDPNINSVVTGIDIHTSTGVVELTQTSPNWTQIGQSGSSTAIIGNTIIPIDSIGGFDVRVDWNEWDKISKPERFDDHLVVNVIDFAHYEHGNVMESVND